jgi:hypothetical protein
MQQELLILPNRLSSLLVLVGLVLQASQVDPCLCVRTFVCVWGGVLTFDLRLLINTLIFSTFSHKIIENK